MEPRHYTESGFAFIANQHGLVLVYDLEYQEISLPGDTDVWGRFLTVYGSELLMELGAQDLVLHHHGLEPLVVPAACMVEVVDFLREVADQAIT